MGPLNLIGLIGLGAALFVAVRIVHSRREGAADDVMRAVLQILAGILILVGLLGCVTALLGPFVLAIFVVAVVSGVFSLVSFFRLERQVVLGYLAVAVEKGIPLPTAARAYALERGDTFGLRSLQLAESLELGTRLPGALRGSGHRFGIGPTLAVGVGDELNCLPDTLRNVIHQEDRVRAVVQTWSDRMAYVTFAFTVAVFVSLYFAIRILPALEKISGEFGQSVPSVLQVFSLGPARPQQAMETVLVGLLALVMLLLNGLSIASVLGLWSRWLPIVGRLSLGHDQAWVLRALGWGLASGHAVPETLECIARHVPGRVLRNRLEQATYRIRAGGAWTAALQASGLVSVTDAGVLSAAERVGNLPWACEQRADSQLRLLEYRLKAAVAVLFPTILLLLGGYVLLLAAGVFRSLAQIIQWLGQAI